MEIKVEVELESEKNTAQQPDVDSGMGLELDMMGLLSACSYALDCVEAELLQVQTRHGKRVAYMSVCMAQMFGVHGDALQDLTACALLHDNALTQYIKEEYNNHFTAGDVETITLNQLGMHCIYGEKNLKHYPFLTDVDGVILYHHENADGTGPFGKTWQEIPLFARLIHLADLLDVYCRSTDFGDAAWERASLYLRTYTGVLFDHDCVDAFFNVFSKEEFKRLGDSDLEERLWIKVPRQKRYYSYRACREMADLFARIIDYKSPFTSMHSLGVAERAQTLAAYMGFDRETVEKMYLAGALHDIGKIAVGNDILEKPGRLTDEEFAKMKNHAGYTYLLLSYADGFEDIRDWAAYHHEKLDGSGYPFGKTADELNTMERMMACVDIYQALTEDRPYKAGMTHEKACAILEDMAAKGWIDPSITAQVRACFQPTELSR